MKKPMKKLILFLALAILETNTISSQCDLYEGAWVDKDQEITYLTIVKENETFWLNSSSGKYQIKGDSDSYIIINGNDVPIRLDRENGLLNYRGIDFIPEFKSKKRQFAGTWKSNHDDIVFQIHIKNGGIYWDIIKGEAEPIRFYPKLTNTGFTFTYGDEQLFYTVKDGIMTDSNGNHYLQISRI